MPPDFLGKLRQLFMPSASPMAHKVTEETLKSPLADSLWAATGGSRPMTMKGQTLRLNQSALASYNPIFDIVDMRPEMLNAGSEEDMRRQARAALMHEAGHRAAMYRLGRSVPGGDAPFKLPKVEVKKSQSAYGSPERVAEDREDRARRVVDKYYQTSPREGYAQAFEYAWQFLTQTPKLIQEGDGFGPYDRSKYADSLAYAESLRPGTGQILSDLLKNEPMFRNHPLQAFYRSSGNR